MTTTTEAPAASAPAESASLPAANQPDSPDDPRNLNLTESERTKWLMTGDLPERYAEGAEEPAETKESKASAPPKGQTETASETEKKSETTQSKSREDSSAKKKGNDYARERNLGHKITARLDELKTVSNKVSAKEAELQRVEQALQERQSKLTAPPAPSAETATPKKGPPVLGPEHKDWASYEAATSAYWDAKIADAVALATNSQKAAIRAEIEAERADAQRASDAARIAAENKQIETAVNKKFVAASKRHQDFRETVFESGIRDIIGRNDELNSFILDSEHSGELVYALGADLEEAERIASLPKYQALRELTKIEDKIALELKPKNQPLPRGAKPPAVVGGQSTSGSDEDDQDMDFETYLRKTNEQQLAAQRR